MPSRDTRVWRCERFELRIAIDFQLPPIIKVKLQASFSQSIWLWLAGCRADCSGSDDDGGELVDSIGWSTLRNTKCGGKSQLTESKAFRGWHIKAKLAKPFCYWTHKCHHLPFMPPRWLLMLLPLQLLRLPTTNAGRNHQSHTQIQANAASAAAARISRSCAACCLPFDLYSPLIALLLEFMW